ncbi:MAG: energy transducer TonB [Desulfobacteraceae bacterium]|nr:energy transducer TonB [Desulfobacteraceae bacterium]
MKKFWPWIGAALVSILLNVLFFSLMPLMTDQDGDILTRSIPAASKVNVVRLKRPDSEVRKKEKKPPKPEPPKPEKPVKKQPRALSKQKPAPLPRLDFQLNPNLPATPGLPVFPMEQVTLDPHSMDNAYTPGELDNTLTPVTHVPPIYPFQAKRRGIQGWVKVKFLVNAQGRVEQISILDSDPETIFDQSVLNVLPKWRFSPGTIEGVNVNTWVVTTIRFELEQ